MTEQLDPRRHPYRSDLAARYLEGQVTAKRFADGAARRVAAASVPVHREPSQASEMDTEALFGETVTVYDDDGQWAWGQLASDGYVGYLPSALLAADLHDASHRVVVPRTLVFAEPSIKTAAPMPLGLTATVSVAGAEGALSELVTGGFVPTRHLAPLGEGASDFVAVAEWFLGAPYLWGGKQTGGLDCSGLVQLALSAGNIACPRDTYVQETELPGDTDPSDVSALQRGDIVFWKGHVGMMVNPSWLLHANAFHMQTVVEPLSEALERIAATAGPVTAIKRLGSP